MIFFKTRTQAREAVQAGLRQWYNKRNRVFIFIPRWLSDGRLVWLQYVYREYNIYIDYFGDYRWDGEVYYYLEDKK